MLEPLKKLDDKLSSPFDPESGYKYNSDDYDIDRRRLAVWVGLVAILLPVVLIAASIFGATEFRDSISHYYYSVFLGDLFIVAIAFIGSFMIIYKGESERETFWANIAGLAAYGVAIFPTLGSGMNADTGEKGRVFVQMDNIPEQGNIKLPDIDPISELNGQLTVETAFSLFQYSEYLHYVGAGIVFVFLAYYCLFVFTREKPDVHFDKNGELLQSKKIRNDLYRISGIVIILCILAILSQKLWGDVWNEDNYTLWFEALALVMFGFAWLVKGKFLGYLEDKVEK